jgi:hypothetical protein
LINKVAAPASTRFCTFITISLRTSSPGVLKRSFAPHLCSASYPFGDCLTLEGRPQCQVQEVGVVLTGFRSLALPRSSWAGGWCSHCPSSQVQEVGVVVMEFQAFSGATSSGRLELSPFDSLPTSLNCCERCSQKRPGANLASERPSLNSGSCKPPAPMDPEVLSHASEPSPSVHAPGECNGC